MFPLNLLLLLVFFLLAVAALCLGYVWGEYNGRRQVAGLRHMPAGYYRRLRRSKQCRTARHNGYITIVRNKHGQVIPVATTQELPREFRLYYPLLGSDPRIECLVN